MRAEAELADVRVQLKKAQESAVGAQAAQDAEGALKMLRIQLQKAEIDKKSLQQQVRVFGDGVHGHARVSA